MNKENNPIDPAIFISIFVAIMVIFSYIYFSNYIISPNSVYSSNLVNQSNSPKIQITTSFRAITLLVKPIAGNLVSINQILPPGADPHNFDPTPQDAIGITQSKLFFYDSNNLEQWAINYVKSDNPDIQMISFQSSINSNQTNPHYWLNPVLAMTYVKSITSSLVSADPKDSVLFYNNEKIFLNQLNQLNQSYFSNLQNCTTRSVLTSHSFLNYLSNQYNFSQISIAGPSPDATPSISQIVSVINVSKQNNARAVLAEPDETINIANSVATELSIPTLSFDTMEVLTSNNSNSSYIDIENQNLKKLTYALGCN